MHVILKNSTYLHQTTLLIYYGLVSMFSVFTDDVKNVKLSWNKLLALMLIRCSLYFVWERELKIRNRGLYCPHSLFKMFIRFWEVEIERRTWTWRLESPYLPPRPFNCWLLKRYSAPLNVCVWWDSLIKYCVLTLPSIFMCQERKRFFGFWFSSVVPCSKSKWARALSSRSDDKIDSRPFPSSSPSTNLSPGWI
jgi:hypothetical protein